MMACIAVNAQMYLEYTRPVQPKPNWTGITEFINNTPVTFMVVKESFYVPSWDNTKYYIYRELDNGAEQLLDSFKIADFKNDTLKRSYLMNLSKSRYICIANWCWTMKPVSVITEISDATIDHTKKYRYFDVYGREMVEPKGLVIREDGVRINFVE